ncbi:hypothetical protein F5883DRAFT_516211 [Diaporthe sp. PMI_573]|nr:hypothetical protein F5883DRAFT_516211 [Diaporthaceae sp. PMI_573]
MVSPFELTDNAARFIRQSIQHAKQKLEKYRDLLEEARIPWFATILHPGYTAAWLKENMNPAKYVSVIEDFKAYFEEHYPAQLAAESVQPQAKEQERAIIGNKLAVDNDFYQRHSQTEDEMEAFLLGERRPL